MEGMARTAAYELTQDQLNEIAAIAGREAIQVYRAEQIKEARKREKNENKVVQTKKMLSSYRRIKATLKDEEEFSEEEKVELRWKFIEDIMGNVREVAGKSDRTIEEAEKRRQRDRYCIYRIEKAVEMYRNECETSGSEEAQRRYRELDMLYLKDKQYTIQEIAEIEKVSDKTVYKDVGIACRIVAVYLLGI